MIKVKIDIDKDYLKINKVQTFMWCHYSQKKLQCQVKELTEQLIVFQQYARKYKKKNLKQQGKSMTPIMKKVKQHARDNNHTSDEHRDVKFPRCVASLILDGNMKPSIKFHKNWNVILVNWNCNNLMH